MAMLADLVRDFRYAGRSLARSPGFTVVAVAVLALGIGATSAIFSLVSAVWLRPLPFADAERIVTLWVDPILGHTFTVDDGADEPVVIREGFWLRRLGGDPAAVGRTITLDGPPHTVVGVVPRDFRFPNGEVDVFGTARRRVALRV